MRIQSLRRSEPDTSTMPVGIERLDGAEARGDTRRGERIGELLVARGALTVEQAEQTARAQRGGGARFGATAVALGFADQATIDDALAAQFNFAVTSPGGAQLDPSLSTALGARDRASELIRSLRDKLWQELQAARAAAPATPPLVTVASMSGAVGRRVIAGNLAIAFAQAGTRTLLIDADMRNPALHRLFRASNQSGLSTWLAGRQARPEIVGVEAIVGLSFLSAGPVPPNPAELLVRLGPALLELRAAANAELVLLNAPPFGTADDAYLVAAAAPAVLMVTRRHFTRANPLLETVKRLRAGNARIVGSVLNVA